MEFADTMPAESAPSSFRPDTGAGETIRFAVGAGSLGAVLVAESARGLCAILLGDRPEGAIRELESRFPDARLLRDDPGLDPSLRQVVAFVEDPARGLDLPLDLRGTPFQHQVWQALRDIPAGATASYSAIAAQIGAPKEAYAVGEACAANVLAVAVPCHRVVRKDGTLAGFRWGFKRKRALLTREGGLLA